MLNDSQSRVGELKMRIQEYMLEVERVRKLLDSKDRERQDLLDNFQNLSKNSCAQEGDNIQMDMELRQSR